MSQIKHTSIEGDVTTGRHVTSGGNATVRGHATVKRNLTVEGWLEARNVRGVNKGVFRTPEELEARYPEPEPGWWAIVGDELPGPLYVAYANGWHATGKTGGNPNVEMSSWREDLDGLRERTEETEADIRRLRETEYMDYLQGTTLTDGSLRIDFHRSSADGVSAIYPGVTIPLASSAGAGLASPALLEYVSLLLSMHYVTGIRLEGRSIRYTWVNGMGTDSRDFGFDLPLASETEDGLMTAAQAQSLSDLNSWKVNLDEWFDEWDPATVKSDVADLKRAVTGKEIENQKVYDIIGQAEGICPLDEYGKVPRSLLPAEISSGGTEGGTGCQCGTAEYLTEPEAVDMVSEIISRLRPGDEEPEPPDLTEDDFATEQDVIDLVNSIFS